MEMAAVGSLSAKKVFPVSRPSDSHVAFAPAHALLSFPFCPSRVACSPKNPYVIRAKKRSSQLEPVLKRTSNQEEEVEEENTDEFENEPFMDDDDDDDGYFEDDFEMVDTELSVGDGSGGGGILLAGTWWDKKALAIAEEVSQSLDGDFKIYAFKTSSCSTIRVRIEKLSNKYGSPSITDIGDFSAAYRARLDEAELAGAVPENISLEVSSPGVERLVRIPQDLDRFKDLPMYVKYVIDVAATGSSQESDGVFKLVSFDLESRYCTWCVADVKINREQAGKGRPLSKKQRDWRLQLPFDSLRLVRLYSEF